ncbi:hypothetical protein MJ904_23610 [Massilia sp. MB5]|uniref:hypothetical protein n=1 Tax=Massilia sp. MB5 TaxID=2919578 RepID=UPI001F0F8A1C|nr:hypothetical protein [Massilia sp. MB5]UMR29981.1 hypothetical protein MJ904_23610 [Massilia sp. MB5]
MNQRTQILLGIAWLLFWLLLTVTAIQDFQRNGNDGPLWQPVLWEGSSALASTTLLFLQRHFTRRHDHLLVTPWRWFARQAIWLPVTWPSLCRWLSASAMPSMRWPDGPTRMRHGHRPSCTRT